jgi:hypothetical protein
MKEKSFESRRVRTQPRTKTAAAGAALRSASLTEIGESTAESLPDDCDGTSKTNREFA